MEFTDGLNELFFGGQYRWIYERWTPYVGFGVGPAFPHVEVLRALGPPNPRTFDYQFDGVTVEGLVDSNTISAPAFRCSATAAQLRDQRRRLARRRLA